MKIVLYFDTLKHLRFKQILFQIIYRIKYPFIPRLKNSKKIKNINILNWENIIENENTFFGNNTFKFLNVNHKFSKIDWNFSINKKLWLYNLNYFEYLNQNKINKKDALELVTDFSNNYNTLKDGKESYPTSLRIINLIKFISANNINKENIFCLIREDSNRLLKNLEFHLYGNHLLENAFALLFSSFLFNDKKYFRVADKILKNELKEQILNDGAHYELSPMYHSIILYRILDSINLIRLNNSENIFNAESKKLILTLESCTVKMFSWLNQMHFKNGDMAMFNDCAKNISPNLNQIIKYFKKLNLKQECFQLSDSGFRKIQKEKYEVIVDVGKLGPRYQSGHGHADTFSFIFYTSKPILIDPGISTYNKNKIRLLERSTANHNTVSINGLNSSKIWSAFRVGKRAEVEFNKDSESHISVFHDGYSDLGVIHQRDFIFNENKFVIEDKINSNIIADAHFHFHPNCKIRLDKKK